MTAAVAAEHRETFKLAEVGISRKPRRVDRISIAPNGVIYGNFMVIPSEFSSFAMRLVFRGLLSGVSL